MKKVLVIQKKSLGEEHPDTLGTRNSLANVLAKTRSIQGSGRYLFTTTRLNENRSWVKSIPILLQQWVI